MFYIVKCIFITIRTRTFHKNMSILVLIFAGQWFEVVVANLLSWPYETGYWTIKGIDPSKPIKQWWTDDPTKLIHITDWTSNFWFFISGFIKIHYFTSMATVLLIISVERSFACFFITDYERKSRIWIAVLIITLFAKMQVCI
uniref:Uncharacterized protein n=2 Tax=Caenorhabditis japonica TaxID=281687 RepID=A0A8R1DQS7_CAEJA